MGPRKASLSSPKVTSKARAQRPRQNAGSIRPLHGLLIACQKLVRVGRPGNREQRQNRYNGQRFHPVMVVFDCGQKRQSLAHFLDQPGKQSWRQPPAPFLARSGPSLRTVALPTHFSVTIAPRLTPPDPNWQSSKSAVGRWHDGASRSKSSIPVVERGDTLAVIAGSGIAAAPMAASCQGREPILPRSTPHDIMRPVSHGRQVVDPRLPQKENKGTP